MNTKLVMTASAVMLGATGLMLTFIPVEIANYLDMGNTKQLLVLQIAGAIFFAFALLNWITRTSTIGGIYNKPIAMANFSHFTIGSLALIKSLVSHPGADASIWGITIVYTIFAITFAFIGFRKHAASKNYIA